MTERTLSLELGNLICRFGSQKVMLDMAEDIVLPAFLDESLIRTYDRTSYFFHQVVPVKLAESSTETVVGVVGRYIKDTTLEREQIFEQGQGLVKTPGSLRSSPSSLFLLILNNHRLIFVKETKDGPSKESFRSTLLHFLRQKHDEFINAKHADNANERERNPDTQRLTKKELRETFPRPTLELIPLTTQDSIEAFIKKYGVLKTVEISLSERNDENDNDPFFDQVQKRKDAIGSSKTTIKHSNSKGLDKSEAIKEISEATNQGNQAVLLSGLDKGGDPLRGNNEKFQLRKPIEDLSRNTKKAGKELYASFSGIVSDGLISVPKTTRKAISSVNALLGQLL